MKISKGDIFIKKYKRSRYWSIWIGEELLAVTVYKKGAVAIREKIVKINFRQD